MTTMIDTFHDRRLADRLADSAFRGAYVDAAIRERIRTVDMLTEGQFATLRAVWIALGDLDPDAKRKWLLVIDDEGFTRLARIAMGQGDAVFAEVRLMLDEAAAT